MRAKQTPSSILERLRAKDWTVLGRAISIVENHEEGWEEILRYACKEASDECLIIGLTGAGGTGKSTLSDKMIKELRTQGLRIGVLPVDPSSPYTGGAVLGDRLRMSSHSRDTNVFIHSLGSRGLTGGLSRAAKEILYLYRAFGFDVIIVESVGAGQGETDITDFVDVTVLVLAPGNGDSIQMIKAGTQETADVFVVNKADRPEADVLYQQLVSVTQIMPIQRRPEVVRTNAVRSDGIQELIDTIYRTKERLLPFCEDKKVARIENEIRSSAAMYYEDALRDNIRQLLPEVLSGNMTSFDAGRIIGKSINIKKMTFPQCSDV